MKSLLDYQIVGGFLLLLIMIGLLFAWTSLAFNDIDERIAKLEKPEPK